MTPQRPAGTPPSWVDLELFRGNPTWPFDYRDVERKKESGNGV
jgi:hypothetical protein